MGWADVARMRDAHAETSLFETYVCHNMSSYVVSSIYVHCFTVALLLLYCCFTATLQTYMSSYVVSSYNYQSGLAGLRDGALGLMH